MTAPTGDTIHAALTDALRTRWAFSADPHDDAVAAALIADTLTPTVQQLIAQAVTTALNAAADDSATIRELMRTADNHTAAALGRARAAIHTEATR